MHRTEYYIYYIPIMGNDVSLLNHYDIARFYRKQDWLKIASLPQHELWKHKFTHQTSEVYILHQPPSIQDMDCFEFRSKQPQLVKVFFIDANQEQPTCNINNSIKLFVEHIPSRLNTIHSLSQQQALTTLQTALKGFRVIQKRFEAVQPLEELIGFNEQGKTKVWLNKEWQLNTKGTQSLQFGNKYNQAIRIHKLFHIIQQKTVGTFFPHTFKQQFLSSTINYDEALACLRRFAYTHALSLSSYLDDSRREEVRSKTRTVHRKDIRQYTNQGCRRQQKEFSFPQLQKTVSATNIHKRIETNPRIPLSSSQSFYRMQFPSADYSCSQHIQSSLVLPHPKINFVNTNTPKTLINIDQKRNENNNEESERKYTIIDKIQVDFSTVEKCPPKEEQNKISPSSIQGKIIQKEKERKKEKIDEEAQKEHQKQKKQKELESVLGKSQSFKIVRVQSLCETILLNQSQELKDKQTTHKKTQEKNQPQKHKATQKSHQKEDQDFLDVHFLQKSLERKLKDQQNSPNSPKLSHTPHQVHNFEEDMLNIDKLEEGLMKFEKSQKSVHKDLQTLHHEHESFQSKVKDLEKDISTNQEITFKYIQEAEHKAQKREHHHLQKEIKETLDYQIPSIPNKSLKKPVQPIDFSKSYQHHSHSYDSNHLHYSYRTQTSFNQYSSLSYEPHQKRTSFQRSYVYDTKTNKNPIWSAQQLPQNQTSRLTKKSPHIDIEQKYLKHVKSKERHFKPSSSAVSQSQGQGLFSHGQIKKESKPTSSKLTYDQLRSYLRTDL